MSVHGFLVFQVGAAQVTFDSVLLRFRIFRRSLDLNHVACLLQMIFKVLVGFECFTADFALTELGVSGILLMFVQAVKAVKTAFASNARIGLQLLLPTQRSILSLLGFFMSMLAVHMLEITLLCLELPLALLTEKVLLLLLTSRL
jgi:hypothetical protein